MNTNLRHLMPIKRLNNRRKCFHRLTPEEVMIRKGL